MMFGRNAGGFGLLLLALAGGPAPAAEGEGSPLSVGAYYYPWYGDDGRHWELGYDGRNRGRGPALGEYSSRSPETLRRHLEWSRQFGIDYLIGSWWGPGSWEDETLLEHFLPEWERAEAEGSKPPSLSLLYEAEGLLGLDPERGIVFDEAAVEAFAEHFRWIAERYLSHPAYHRVEGRPVVYLYLSRVYAGDYRRALAKARAAATAKGFELHLVGDEVYWGEPEPERIPAFDAVTAYNLHGPPEFAGLEDWSAFLEACEGLYERWRGLVEMHGVALVPGAMPGFSTEDAVPGLYYEIPRRLRPGGAPHSTLEASVSLALRYRDRNTGEIAVTSFNEWHEGTQLEPGSRPGAGEALRRVLDAVRPRAE